MYRALTLALILSLLGCSDQTDTLRIGANRWLGYGPLYLADDLHWMTPSGYRLVEYPHTTGVLRGYRNGLLDAALLTLDEALILQSSGQPVQILLVADVSAGAATGLGPHCVDDARCADHSWRNWASSASKRWWIRRFSTSCAARKRCCSA